MSEHYILDADGNVQTADLMTWASWYKTAERHVGDTHIGAAHISTVFLGLDHSFSHIGPPVLWETMIFWTDHELDQYQERYTSKADALAGHERACQLVRDATPPPPPPANEPTHE